MYQSYDSGKLTSTIINLDIEEMSFCFACAILKHIQHFLKERKVKLYGENLSLKPRYKSLQPIKEEEVQNSVEQPLQLIKSISEQSPGPTQVLGSGTQKAPQHANDPSTAEDSKYKINPMEEPTQIKDSEESQDNMNFEQMDEVNDILRKAHLIGAKYNDTL